MVSPKIVVANKNLLEKIKVFVWDLETTSLTLHIARIVQIAIVESAITPTPSQSLLAIATAAKDKNVSSSKSPRTQIEQLAKFSTSRKKGVSKDSKKPASNILLKTTLPSNQGVFNALVNPRVPIFNAHIHHITRNMVRHQCALPKVWKDVVNFIEERTPPGYNPVLLAHNGRMFDEKVLGHEVCRHDLSVPANWKFGDTLPLCRNVFDGLPSVHSGKVSHSMKSLCSQLDVTNKMEHNAVSDVMALDQILKHAAQKIESKCQVSIFDWINCNTSSFSTLLIGKSVSRSTKTKSSRKSSKI